MNETGTAQPVQEMKHVKLQAELIRLEKTRDMLRLLLNEVQGNYKDAKIPPPGGVRKAEEVIKTRSPSSPNLRPVSCLAETLDTAPDRIAVICDEIRTDILPELKAILF